MNLLVIFLAEASDLIEALFLGIQQWSTQSSAHERMEAIKTIKNELHTLKGSARMVNQIDLSTVVNDLESLCTLILADPLLVDDPPLLNNALIASNPQSYHAHLKDYDECVQNYYQYLCTGCDHLAFLVEGFQNSNQAAIQCQEKKQGQDHQDDQQDVQSIHRERPYQENDLIVSSQTILVVDDSITFRTIAKNFLERHHYQVALAFDGLEALEKIEQIKPDLLLLDLEMPRANGFEVAKALRSNVLYKRLPIIMITFAMAAHYKAIAAQLGIDCFVNKPYQETVLLKIIQDLLKRPKH